MIPGVLLTGIVADLLYWRLKPSIERSAALRLFTFGVPFVYSLCYFVTLMITNGITWTIHLWLGSSFMAGVLGFLLKIL
jgi:hypothetical protein